MYCRSFYYYYSNQTHLSRASTFLEYFGHRLATLWKGNFKCLFNEKTIACLPIILCKLSIISMMAILLKLKRKNAFFSLLLLFIRNFTLDLSLTASIIFGNVRVLNSLKMSFWGKFSRGATRHYFEIFSVSAIEHLNRANVSIARFL